MSAAGARSPGRVSNVVVAPLETGPTFLIAESACASPFPPGWWSGGWPSDRPEGAGLGGEQARPATTGNDGHLHSRPSSNGAVFTNLPKRSRLNPYLRGLMGYVFRAKPVRPSSSAAREHGRVGRNL
jgi:hypothetical protein